MDGKFYVDFVSPVEFEYLAAEIRYQDQILCRIKIERPDKRLEIEFFAVLREPIEPVVAPLSDFIKLIGEVSEELVDARDRLDLASPESL
ncbi:MULTISPECIES: hypothetical protein [Dyella]|uniref:Uncharacterized protein n=2 Tax=Dyella TaxID=231454 RepID=A0A4R0YNU3_9GAMM|nr:MULTISPECIES: hypothetical protein [Dyella]TBR36728.1 hypothetical protein EYV96_12485 [Dyella terrae]TCI08181.1 hypothetical protein EZM97_26385 [Dyella soli]